MKSSDSTGSGKLERKTVEKNRRVHMKNLCMKLSSLIPKDDIPTSKDACTQLDILGQAASYIDKLRDRVDTLRQEREMAMASTNRKRKEEPYTAAAGDDGGQQVAVQGCSGRGGRGEEGFMVRLPVVEVRQQDLNLEVVLVSGLHKTFKLHQVISVIEEEGGEVVNASFSVVHDKIYHTIHTQALSSGMGLDAAKVTRRLKELFDKSTQN